MTETDQPTRRDPLADIRDAAEAGHRAGREAAAGDIESWIGAYDDPTSTDRERDVAHGLRQAAHVARTGERP